MPAQEAAGGRQVGRALGAAGETKNVLLLHSYNSIYEWTEELTDGIRAVLDKAPFEVELWTEYLDAKRLSLTERNDLMKALLEVKYGWRKIDLVIAADDDALAFLTTLTDGPLARTPVVFGGVSNRAAIAKLPKDRYTGVEEVFEPDLFLRAAMEVTGDRSTVAVVVDNSRTGRDQLARYGSLQKMFPRARFEFLNGAVLSLEEIEGRLKRLNRGSIVVVSAFTRDRLGNYLSQQEAGERFSAAAPCPVVSPNTSRLGQGFLVGTANAGNAHGGIVAAMAVRLLSGLSPQDIAIRSENNLRLIVDDTVAAKWGISPSRYPDNAIVVNPVAGWRQFSQEHKQLVLLAAFLVLLQTAIIGALILNRLRRRRAEAALRENRAHLERAQKIARLGSWEIDPDTKRTTWSDEVFRLYGLEPGAFEPSFERLLELVHAADRERLKAVVERNEEQQAGRTTEYRIARPDGEIRHMRSLAEWQEASVGRRRIAGVVQDVTELKEMEARVWHSQRVESLGNLAGGVAHDFNNLLTIINGYSQLLLMKMKPEDPQRQHMAQIHQAGERAAALTQQLLAFSRKQMMTPQLLDLNDVIRSIEKLLKPLLGAGIGLELDLQEVLKPLRADRSQLEQVLLNLAANARDALEDGGTLTISTRNEVLASLTSWNDLELEPGAYVRLIVEDDGQGMSAEVKQRAFEPFFTTKPAGKGTGLGLSTVYGIVRQSNGSLSIASEPGGGTSVHVLFPAAEGEPAARPAVARELAGGRGRVLVVEDEDQIRRLAAETLREAGYEVAEACGPAEALEMCRPPLHWVPDLALVDVVMPGGSGPELVRELEQRLPELQVLFMSGYAAGHAGDVALAQERFLAKPFDPAELAERVKGLLESGG